MNAPLAQSDRAAAFEAVGWRFESSRGHSGNNKTFDYLFLL